MSMLLEAMHALNLLAVMESDSWLSEAKKAKSDNEQAIADYLAHAAAKHAEMLKSVPKAKASQAAAKAEIDSMPAGFKDPENPEVPDEVVKDRRNAPDKKLSPFMAKLKADSEKRHELNTPAAKVKGKTGPKPKVKPPEAPEAPAAASSTAHGVRKVKTPLGGAGKLHVGSELSPKQKLHNLQTMHHISRTVASNLRKKANTSHEPGTSEWQKLHNVAAHADSRANHFYTQIHKHLAAHAA